PVRDRGEPHGWRELRFRLPREHAQGERERRTGDHRARIGADHSAELRHLYVAELLALGEHRLALVEQFDLLRFGDQLFAADPEDAAHRSGEPSERLTFDLL